MAVLVKKFFFFFFVLTIIFVLAGLLFADDEVGLEKIVVTANRYEQAAQNIPAGITIITPGDITDSNAYTPLDVLRGVSGVSVRDWTGNSTKASVDMRGFGEQGGLNTLVLIDGRRVNEIDLSGADWTQVPLDQIEKIEVLRGGSGSVLYGDNAVGGVINIITKKGSGKEKAALTVETGSYDMNKEHIAVSGARDPFAYWFDASHNGTNGYRQNNYYKAQDFSSKLNYSPDHANSFHLATNFHSSEYGLPGALSESQLLTVGRRASVFPTDHATDEDYYIAVGEESVFENEARLNSDISFRRKKVDSFFLSSFLGFNPIYRNRIDTIGFTPKYILPGSLASHANTLITGVDLYRSDYSSDNYSDADTLQNFTDINKTTKGFYCQDEFSATDKLNVLGGWRYEGAQYDFNYHDNTGFNADVDKTVKPAEKALNSGLVYAYAEGSSAFVNFSESFRFPAADEYFSTFSTPPVNTELKPQTSKNYEAGIKHRFNANNRCEITLFRMDLKNELYYNPQTFSNSNYDKTRHEGLEVSLDSRINEKLSFIGTYTLTNAEFRGGPYDHKDIPMVPQDKASGCLKFLYNQSVACNVLATYIGKRYFINDQANLFSRLNGYLTVDTNVSYRYKDLAVTLAANNIFDRFYAEYGVCNNTSGAKNYYPAPGRNFSIKLQYAF